MYDIVDLIPKNKYRQNNEQPADYARPDIKKSESNKTDTDVHKDLPEPSTISCSGISYQYPYCLAMVGVNTIKKTHLTIIEISADFVYRSLIHKKRII
jgi:hypothetical protein